MKKNKLFIRMAMLLLTLVGSSCFAQESEQVEVSLNQDPQHPAYYYGTWYEGIYSYQAPTGVEVWYATSVEGGVIHLEKSTDNIIYNKCGVILRGPGTTVTLTKLSVDGSAGKNSALTGTDDSAITQDNNYNYYVLSYAAEYGVGFYRLKEGITIPRHRAYYMVDKSSSSAHEVLLFDFGDDQTGVEAISMEEPRSAGTTPSSAEGHAFYNLQGCKVAQPAKGVYIVNGRKMVVK